MSKPTNDELNKILRKIGKNVSFKFPGNERNKKGRLEDRAVIVSPIETGGVPYWDVVDLIKFEDQEEPWIRFGYYRKPKHKLNWGSQTTLTEPVSTWKILLVNTAREKEWFRDLLKAVCKELK